MSNTTVFGSTPRNCAPICALGLYGYAMTSRIVTSRVKSLVASAWMYCIHTSLRSSGVSTLPPDMKFFLTNASICAKAQVRMASSSSWARSTSPLRISRCTRPWFSITSEIEVRWWSVCELSPQTAVSST